MTHFLAENQSHGNDRVNMSGFTSWLRENSEDLPSSQWRQRSSGPSHEPLPLLGKTIKTAQVTCSSGTELQSSPGDFCNKIKSLSQHHTDPSSGYKHTLYM